jgi:hypothetical protein
MEPLESRHLLSAGSVAVSVTAGVLTLTGDANDDAVQISGVTTDPGTFKIQGLRGTLINGVANGSVTEPGVTSIATSGWGNGRDFLGFTDNNPTGLAGGLSITMGDGNDQVVLGKDGGHGWGQNSTNATTKVNGDVQVTLGGGNDKVDIKNFSVTTTQGFLVTMGNGNDKFDAENVTVSATGVAAITGDQGFGVQMGDGNDHVELDNISVTADGTVSGRQGLGFSLGNGNNRFQASGISVSLSGTVSGLQGFGVMIGNGNNRVSIDDADITGGQGFAVSLGNGNNNLNLGGSGGGNGWCGGGDNRRGGSNGIDVTGSVLVSLGTGRDKVNVYDTTVGGDLNIQKTTAGGSGATIQLQGVTVDGTLNIDTSGDTANDKVILGAGDCWEHGWWNHANSSSSTNTFNTANVTMGSGQNTLKVNNSTITTANFDGGTPGPNTYVQGKNVTITTLNKTNFT